MRNPSTTPRARSAWNALAWTLAVGVIAIHIAACAPLDCGARPYHPGVANAAISCDY